MRQKTYLLLGVALLGYSASSNANITSASWGDDNDGAVVCSGWGSSGIGTSSADLTMTGVQNSAPGHMVGWVDTDSTSDPTLGLYSSVDNDTSLTWTSYAVNVYMNAPFTVLANSPQVTTPGDWNPSGVTYGLSSNPQFPGDYEASFVFASGTPITPGGELDFQYAIHFGSSLDYSFAQEMIPMGEVSQVPEPSDLALVSGLVFGGFQLVKRLRNKV
ncbi:MAG: hypothetical protein ABSA83_04285 [Verrucomicrobiota bacterium]